MQIYIRNIVGLKYAQQCILLGNILSLVTSGGEEAEAVLVVGVEQPFAFVESAISFIWTLSEYCQLLDQLPLGMRPWGNMSEITCRFLYMQRT
jgi:hypothetical protein